LFVVNNIHRAVPTKEAGWASDGIDIKGTLARIFSLQSEQTLVSPDVPSTLSGSTFWAAFKKAEGQYKSVERPVDLLRWGRSGTGNQTAVRR
jgi:hypothetical protein